MTATQERRIDAAAIRRDYLDGLNALTARRELCERLAEHVRSLGAAVRARLPDMDAYRRAQAEHCLTRAAETLDGVPAASYDLAVSARALLALYRRPRVPE